jgi:hypothetical protein
MNEMVFKIFITALTIILAAMVVIIVVEIIAHRKADERKMYTRPITHLRSYCDGYTFADDEDLYKAQRIVYITSKEISFSETGINGKFERVWSL